MPITNIQPPPALQQAELWPIKAKGAVIRLNPLSDPAIEQKYHAAMEQGRLLESSITDATFILAQKRQDLIEKISIYTQMNNLAVDGQLTHHGRFFKYIADSISILRAVNQIQSEITGLVTAINQNIGLLQTVQLNVQQMIQANLNAVAFLLQEICNWGLPSLPSIPNLFPDSLWNWNGFNFSPLAAFAEVTKSLQNGLNFPFNFSFNQCFLTSVNGGVLPTPPATVQTYSGLTVGTPLITPPLGGILPSAAVPATPVLLAQTSVPVYGPTFNPNSSMLGSVPDPSTIESDYQMPAATYQANIVSIVPATRDQVIEPGDSDYNNPNLAVRVPDLRKSLQHNITLEQVVISNYDPYVTSAWIMYLSAARTGRGGNWLPNFQAVYSAVIQASVDSFAKNNVPWNNYQGTLSNAPKDIPFVDLVKNLNTPSLQNLLWRLSYIEAALLGYTRATDWDSGADPMYLSAFTGLDLDYRVSTVAITPTTTINLGQGVAEFPVPCTFPTSIATVLNEVIAQATLDIQNDPSYQSPNPAFRFIFDQFGQSKVVDRFSQFWREFNNNVVIFLAQDPYIVSQVVSYVATLDGAVNPLGDPRDYQQMTADANTRNRAWVPGTPLLNLPKAPVVSFSNSTAPTAVNNGWSGLDLNAQAFLSRPDIQGQPIPVQLAMLRTNLSFAAISLASQNITNAIQTQITNAQNLLKQVTQIGFHVTAVETSTIIPPDSSSPLTAGMIVTFDSVSGPNDFDFTHNVSNIPPGVFILQAGGTYALVGQLTWDFGGVGIRTVTIFQNGVSIYSVSTDSMASGNESPFLAPVVLQFSTSGDFEAGDVVQVVASHNLSSAQTLTPGSFFSMIQTAADTSPAPPVSGNGDDPKQFIAGANFPAFTAVVFDSNGDVVPVNPNASTPGPPFPYIAGIAVSPGITGQSVSVATNYGDIYDLTGISLTVGGGIYVGSDSVITQRVPSTNWLIYVGQAASETSFIFEPNIPQGNGGGSGNATSINNIPISKTLPTDGQVLSYVAANADLEWVSPVSSARETFSKTTGSLAPNAAETGTMLMVKSFIVLEVSSDRPCRIELYSTTAQRDADAGRPVGTEPTGEHGVICDISLDVTTSDTFILSSAAIGANMETVPSDNIAYRITNNDSITSTVSVTITVLPLES